MVATSATHQHKRHGKHQPRTRHFLKVYWPYLPMAVIIGLGLVFSALWQPRSHHGVLAYATSMSVSGLLQATNQDRLANGEATLNLNSQLDQAAQAKANDMVARDYWSHNTPDGNPPWVFITNAGYKYKAAGENLAYGFDTSDDTVAGWMNSPEHKANMLNSGFVDVGFGFANSANYQNTGPETVVVAYYATPLYSAPAAPTTSTSSSKPLAQPQTKAAAQPATPVPTPTAPTSAKSVPSTNQPSTVKATPIIEPATHQISRLTAISNGAVPWLSAVASIALVSSVVLLTMRHAYALHKWLRKGEKYVLHHMAFDVTLISLFSLCLIVSQTAGFVR